MESVRRSYRLDFSKPCLRQSLPTTSTTNDIAEWPKESASELKCLVAMQGRAYDSGGRSLVLILQGYLQLGKPSLEHNEA
ncbi:Protein of unknown function [Gryllus bimaculatus]|nr:Protein of unknown function [Gryllus bimaculatus]